MKIIYNSKEIKPETMSQREYNINAQHVIRFFHFINMKDN
mgnify:CR=1 FL=1